MATSFLKKTMVYLGLVDDEYDDHDDYEDRAPRGFSVSSRANRDRRTTCPKNALRARRQFVASVPCPSRAHRAHNARSRP